MTGKYCILSVLIMLIPIVGIFSQTIPSYVISSQEETLEKFDVYMIEDDSRTLTIDDVAEGKAGGIITSSRFYVESNKSDYWFCFTLINNSSETVDRIIRFDEPYAEQANLCYKQNGFWHTEKAGLEISLDERQVYNRNPVFQVTVPPGSSRTYYLKLHSNYGMLTIGIFVQGIQNFLNRETLEVATYLFYLGAALSLILYNLILFVSIREKLYLYYILHGLSFVIWVLMYSGFDLYFGISEILHYRFNSIANLTPAFQALFTRYLLKTYEHFPRVDKTLKIIAGIAITSCVLSFFSIGLYHYLTYIAIPCYLFFLSVGIYSFRKHIELSKFYIFSMGLYFLSIIFLALLLMDLLPYTLIFRYAYIPGSLVELTIFGTALAYRVKLLQFQNLSYQKELLNTERLAREEMENTVRIRTLELKIANEKLEKMATTDGLTELANRRSLDDYFKQTWLECKRKQENLSIIMADIDYFKKYNDRYGHQQGDVCLKKVAESMMKCVNRPRDFCARYGGEEFLILLPDTTLKGALYIAECIRSSVTNLKLEHSKSDCSEFVTLSIGVASMIPQEGAVDDEFLLMADKSLYKAKDLGRNRVYSE